MTSKILETIVEPSKIVVRFYFFIKNKSNTIFNLYRIKNKNIQSK